MEQLAIGVFGATAPMLVGRAYGFFEDAGLDVHWSRVKSSKDQFADLMLGKYDLLETAFDNVIFYSLSPANPTGSVVPVTAFAVLDGGMDLGISTRKGVNGIDDLRGGMVAVDAPDTGYAFVLYELLRQSGLEQGRDYSVVEHGSVAQRYVRLLHGDADATLLNYGYELLAADQGCGRLTRSRDVIFPYLGSVLAAQPKTITARRATLNKFLDAYRKSIAYVVEPASFASVVKEISAYRSMDTALAERVLHSELSDVGLVRQVDQIDLEAATAVMKLRARNNGLPRPPSDTEMPSLVASLITRLA